MLLDLFTTLQNWHAKFWNNSGFSGTEQKITALYSWKSVIYKALNQLPQRRSEIVLEKDKQEKQGMGDKKTGWELDENKGQKERIKDKIPIIKSLN